MKTYLNTLKLQNEKIKHAFNRAKLTYDEHSELQLIIGKSLLDLVQQKTNQVNNILDLGCGTGLTTARLAHSFSFMRLHALDIAEQFLIKARQRLPEQNIYIYPADFDQLPQFSLQFDLVFANMSLHWSTNLTHLFNTLYKNLNEQGVFAFSIPLAGTFVELKSHYAVNDFYEYEEIHHLLVQNRFQLLSSDHEKRNLHFEDTLSLLRSIKNVGANHVSHRTYGSLRGKSFLSHQAIQNLTYNIGYFLARK